MTRYDSDDGEIPKDLLGSKKISDAFVKTILSLDPSRPFVIGLFGEWGTGKTTIIKTALNELRHYRYRLKIIEFSPWQSVGDSHFEKQFLEQILISAYSINKYVYHILMLKSWAKIALSSIAILVIGSIIRLIDAPALLIVIYVFLSITLYIAYIRFKSLLPILVFLLSDNPDFDLLKRHLKTKLRKSRRPILVVIDDLDRLPHDDIRKVARLIRGQLDIPKIIYIIVGCKKIIGAALSDKSDSGDGHLFLQKIVNVEINVPPLSEANIIGVFRSKLPKNNNYDSVLNLERWRIFERDLIHDLFLNLREIDRVINSTKFLIDMYTRGGHVEINMLDALVVEILRNLEPEVYVELFKNRQRLLPSSQIAQMRTLMADKDSGSNSEYQELIDKCNSPRKSSLEKLFKLIYLDEGRLDPDDTYRLADSRYMSRYFSFSFPHNSIPREELIDQLNSLIKSETNESWATNSQEKLGSFISECLAQQVFPKREDAIIACTILHGMIEKLDKYHFDIELQIYEYIAFSIMANVKENPFDIFKNILSKMNGLRTCFYVVIRLERIMFHSQDFKTIFNIWCNAAINCTIIDFLSFTHPYYTIQYWIRNIHEHEIPRVKQSLSAFFQDKSGGKFLINLFYDFEAQSNSINSNDFDKYIQWLGLTMDMLKSYYSSKWTELENGDREKVQSILRINAQLNEH